MRITLTEKEADTLILKLKDEDNQELINIVKEIQTQRNKPKSENRINSLLRAREIKTKQTIKKIQDAVKQLNARCHILNIKRVADVANVSYNTVKKYEYLLTKDVVISAETVKGFDNMINKMT